MNSSAPAEPAGHSGHIYLHTALLPFLSMEERRGGGGHGGHSGSLTPTTQNLRFVCFELLLLPVAHI